MASIKMDKNTKEWNMFRDLFQLVETFWIPENNNQYWIDLISAADEFEEKYGGDKLFCSWIAEFLSQKEAEVREMKRGIRWRE